MENNLSENPVLPVTPMPLTNIKPKKSSKVILYILLILVLIPVSLLLGFKYGKSQAGNVTTDTPSNLTSTSSATIVPSFEWKTAKMGGMFSYEYPYGWSVAELWGQNYLGSGNGGIMIAIDPDPINTAPRGGPLATFQISIFNGSKSPDELLTSKMAEFNETNYSGITKEVIDAKIGKVYFFKGKTTGEMYANQPVESYYFTFNQNPNDLINQQVVVATMAMKDDKKLSEMLRHIVLSFKDLTP